MSLPRLRTITVAAVASIGLSGCVYDGYGGIGYGYGGGYYDDYYYPGSYYGWYDDFYYPGVGIYVYDRSGSRHRWSDRHRRYWEGRRDRDGRGDGNWSGYRRDRDGDRWRDGDRDRWRDGSTQQSGEGRQWRRDRTTPSLQQQSGDTQPRRQRFEGATGSRSDGGQWRSQRQSDQPRSQPQVSTTPDSSSSRVQEYMDRVRR